jgi:2-iminobutanoate/2-iminopropanoate deaminase
MPRQSIDIQGFGHVNPIPAATRIGPLVVSSIISPFNPGEREIPATVDDQIANLFHHVGAMLAAAGADWTNVAKMIFYVKDLATRDLLNAPWAARFPDPASRPARHTQQAPLADKVLVACDFLAYIES